MTVQLAHERLVSLPFEPAVPTSVLLIAGGALDTYRRGVAAEAVSVVGDPDAALQQASLACSTTYYLYEQNLFFASLGCSVSQILSEATEKPLPSADLEVSRPLGVEGLFEEHGPCSETTQDNIKKSIHLDLLSNCLRFMCYREYAPNMLQVLAVALQHRRGIVAMQLRREPPEDSRLKLKFDPEATVAGADKEIVLAAARLGIVL